MTNDAMTTLDTLCLARACPNNSTLATLSSTLSAHFVENGRNSTKCFDKVGDKVSKSPLLEQALAIDNRVLVIRSPLVTGYWAFIGHWSLVIAHFPRYAFR